MISRLRQKMSTFPRNIAALAVVAACFASGRAEAQVTASLVAATLSAQPGHDLRVAVKLEHDRGWHTYWVNAGTGFPTAVTWALPEGWKASAIDWPVPHEIKDGSGKLTGLGYMGSIYLPVTIAVPTSARLGAASLNARVSWLMCADVCIPGEADVSLDIPLSADAPAVDDAVQADLQSLPMPRAAAWTISSTRAGHRITLDLQGAPALENAHFFSEDGFIAYDQPQTVAARGTRTGFELPIADDAGRSTHRLVGVIAYTDAQGEYRGVKVDVPIEAGTSAGPAPAARFILTLVFAVMGGLILNLMPCVFPVLGIKIMGFVEQSARHERHVAAHGLSFTLGVILSFWGLAAALAALRSGGMQLGWGFQLQSPLFVFGLAAVMLVFALNLLGVFELGLGMMGVGSSLQMKQGYLGTFFSGVLATVVATPCSAPFLAPALGATLVLPAGQSFVVFTAIAVGLSLPYLLLSIFPHALRWLPKPGRWMETFRQAMAFPLFATVAYLIWVLAAQVSEGTLLTSLIGLTLVAMSLWLYGRYSLARSSTPWKRFGYSAAVLLMVSGIGMGWPRAATPTDIAWETWTPERVAQLQAEGRPMYVDFTARWCATCQANKRMVFGAGAVQRYFRDHHVAALRADWTHRNDAITTELARWDRKAIPFNLVYRPGAASPRELPEILTPDIVLRAFGQD